MTHVKDSMRAGLALGLALAAAAPSATAKPLSDPPQASPTIPAPTIVRVMPSSRGFDWGDAGIGAAGALAVAAIAAGGTLATAGRTRPRTRRRPATNS